MIGGGEVGSQSSDIMTFTRTLRISLAISRPFFLALVLTLSAQVIASPASAPDIAFLEVGIQQAALQGPVPSPWQNQVRWRQDPLSLDLGWHDMGWRKNQWSERRLRLHKNHWRLALGQADYDMPSGLFSFLTSRQDPERLAISLGATLPLASDDAADAPSPSTPRLDLHGIGAWIPREAKASPENASPRYDEGLAGFGLRYRQSGHDWQTLGLVYRLERETTPVSEHWVQGLGWRHTEWPFTWMGAVNLWRGLPSHHSDSRNGEIQGLDLYTEAQWSKAMNPQSRMRIKAQWMGRDWAWPLSPAYAEANDAFGFDAQDPMDSSEVRPSDSARYAHGRLNLFAIHRTRESPSGQFITTLTQRWSNARFDATDPASWAWRTYGSHAWVTEMSTLKAWVTCTIDPQASLSREGELATGWQAEWRPGGKGEKSTSQTNHPLTLMVYGQSENGPRDWLKPRPHRLAARARMPWSQRLRMQWEMWCDWPKANAEQTLGLRLKVQGS
jgi:hypothetical protein